MATKKETHFPNCLIGFSLKTQLSNDKAAAGSVAAHETQTFLPNVTSRWVERHERL